MTALEEQWTNQLRLRDLPVFQPGDYRTVVAVAAHPDDETLGASGCMQALHAAGCAVTLVVASDGEAAFPNLGAEARSELGRVRRAELTEALRLQELSDVRVHWLGLPDSGLAEHTGELVALLRELLAGADCCLLPWPGDPHPDHQAVAEAVLAAAPVTAHRWSYPIWMWHWMRHDDAEVPWELAHRYPLSKDQRSRKSAAVLAFRSQLTDGPDGSPPILPADVLEHFDRESEVLFREPRRQTAPVERFAELYAGDADPWSGATRWYERRKRALLMASLPSERYGTVVEPACGTGLLTAELAQRCDRLFAFDVVPDAVAAARKRLTGADNVHLEQASLPDGFPSAPCDLVVLSEILYYLDDRDLDSVLDRVVAALRPGGEVAAVHWRPWAPEAPRDGAAAHRRLIARPELETLVDHVDDEFLLCVLRRG
ncbi:bifunctional PIG-L family deacetylase/class I SAM-dependent methyltransferase [Allokutzneria sp. A3M-2-11 16]|uniref:bifunctional PIG-L family deacetylase/class I SAM-dependent methyltransferase n=1 Tax=Allokutzneria sp. A3M-2-11 16 TaxID=2962043 RepID=UPI0020B66CD8|nr:bifunctional PIG-L family deacetylase/class I SAM-dependent methyltransferase [Allokutzneria sp. A3M-2-11 16]MCP3803327.1 bifunctional PIG-L family deacetylase/class I SAM-dependent methyltransferase [Allokutzneria sp. A3M-2-11 16]